MRLLLKLIKSAFAVSLVLYLAAVGYLYFAQDGMIFPAPAAQKRSIEGTDFLETKIPTPDGEILYALEHKAEPGEATIILFHGNGGTASSYLDKGAAWINAGFGALLVEYRGYPKSTGAASEAGLYIDAIAAYDYVANRGAEDIAIYGHSLGTGVATNLATQKEIFALVLEAPFDSLMAVASARYPFVPVSTLLRHKFRSDQIIQNVSAPILILHGDKDRTVPISHGRKLLSLAPEATEFIELKGAGHGNLNEFGGNVLAIDFLKAALAQ